MKFSLQNVFSKCNDSFQETFTLNFRSLVICEILKSQVEDIVGGIMRTQSKTKTGLVAELAEIIRLRKEFEKREKELKDQVKSLMGTDLMLETEGFIVLLKDRHRKDLDKTAIMHDLGKAFFERYEKETIYQIMEVTESRRVS